MLPEDFVMLRHGHAVSNEEISKYREWLKQNWFLRWLYPFRTDPELLRCHQSQLPLTRKGHSQIPAVKAWLSNWLKEQKLPTFSECRVSPFVRARETATTLSLPGANWQIDSGLREVNNGVWGAVPDKNWQKKHAKLMRRGFHHFYDSMPNGQSMANKCVELQNTVCSLDKNDENPKRAVLWVSHGMTMQGIRCILEGISPDEYHRLIETNDREFKVGNCQIIHYTRINPNSTNPKNYDHERLDRFGWVRSVNPWNPEYAGHDWREIKR